MELSYLVTIFMHLALLLASARFRWHALKLISACSLTAILGYLLISANYPVAVGSADLVIAAGLDSDKYRAQYQRLEDLRKANHSDLVYRLQTQAGDYPQASEVLLTETDGWLVLQNSQNNLIDISKLKRVRGLELNFQLITGLNRIGFPDSDPHLSADYINDYLQTLKAGRSSAMAETIASNAGINQGLWTQIPHLAYQKFIAGNILLLQYLNSELEQRALIDCAHRYYQHADQMFLTEQLPELRLALRNNQAILATLKLLLQTKNKRQAIISRREAKELFKSLNNLTNIQAVFKINNSQKVTAKTNRQIFKALLS